MRFPLKTLFCVDKNDKPARMVAGEMAPELLARMVQNHAPGASSNLFIDHNGRDSFSIILVELGENKVLDVGIAEPLQNTSEGVKFIGKGKKLGRFRYFCGPPIPSAVTVAA